MTSPTFRRATRDDVQAIVAMLADDALGATRESPADLAPYLAAFDLIDTDPHQLLIVCDIGDRISGTLQLTFIPGLSRRGAMRATIEAVRVSREARGSGLGSEMVQWAIQHARERGCQMIQLTADVSRTDAHRFYERLGFEPTHIGFKLIL